MINARIAQIDHLLSLQINEILHHPEFQKLEATWRGLKYLLSQSETGTMLKIKVLNVSKKDLLRDLQRAPEFDQSALFKKVYEEEYGVFGGTPFGALVGDYYFDKSGQDMELLEKISNVAAAAHAPFLSSASHDLFNLEKFTDLDQPRDLARSSTPRSTRSGRRSARAKTRATWRSGAARSDARAVWQRHRADRGVQLRGARRRHRPHAYLWGNAAYALAANVNKAFAAYGWCASIRGVESGGLVEGLPVHNFRTEAGELVMKCPTEVAGHRSSRKGARGPRFRGARAPEGNGKRRVLQRAVVPEAEGVRHAAGHRERAPLGATAVHLRDVSLRALPEGDDARQDRRLYVARADRLVPEPLDPELRHGPGRGGLIKAQRPLAEARIDVVEIPGKPGAYRAVAFLRPHFQLDELGVAMRLVAELPQPAA